MVACRITLGVGHILLLGPNFSGRSQWLAEMRAQEPWPQCAVVTAFPDLACTGLTSSVAEELVVAAMGRSTGTNPVYLEDQLGLDDLQDKQIDALSGGESVRLALASVVAQGAVDLQIDTALEQLDDRWRRSILALLTSSAGDAFRRIFVADNHLSEDEIDLFKESIRFPQADKQFDRWSNTIDPTGASALIGETAGMEISIESVSFSYPRRSQYVFREVCVTLKPGSLYFLVGDNGSGKSTFVKLLSGTLLPVGGSIRYGADRFEPARSRGRFAGLAFQNPDFQWTSLTIREELMTAKRGRNLAVSLEGMLSTFGIPDSLVNADPHEIPFAFKKRLGIELAVLFGKPWLIFDEPTLGQDYEFRKSLVEFIQRALGRGTGIIVISHDATFRSLFNDAKTLRVGNQKIVLENA